MSFSAEDHVLHGKLLYIRALVIEASAVNELEHAFREAVEDYLAMCGKKK